MKILELFSGTGSVGKVALQEGHEVISVDISNKLMEPTHIVDILQWDYKIYQPGMFDIVWASPPCATFSTIRRCRVPAHRIQQDIQEIGLPLLRKAQEIIAYLQPRLWFIENPAMGAMKQYIDEQHYDVDYCRYEDLGYRKRTRIWTNLLGFEPKLCNKQCYRYTERNRHPLNMAIQSERKNNDLNCTTLAQRYHIPPQLIRELLWVCI